MRLRQTLASSLNLGYLKLAKTIRSSESLEAFNWNFTAASNELYKLAQFILV
jgi:hypothetical protein